MCRPPQSQLKAAVVCQQQSNQQQQQQQQYKQDASSSSSAASSVLDQIDLIAKLQPQGFDAWLPTIVKQEEAQPLQVQVANIMPTSPESVCTEATVPQQLDVLSWLNDFEAELASASASPAVAAVQVQQPQQQQIQQQPFASMPFSGVQDFETAYMFPPQQQQQQQQQPQYQLQHQQQPQYQQNMYTANAWSAPVMSAVPLMPEMQMPMPQTSCCGSEDDDLSLFQSSSSPATMAAFVNTTFEDVHSSHSMSDSSLSSAGVPCDDGSSMSAARMKKMRKRRLAQDLTPEELEKTREVNRVAAQRHRQVLKAKRVERVQQAESIQKKTQAMRQQVQEMSLELKTLKRLVVEMYAPGGSRHHMLAAL